MAKPAWLTLDNSLKILNCIALISIAVLLYKMYSVMPHSVSINDLRTKKQTIQDIPRIIIHDGNVEVSGNVSVDGHVDVNR